MSLQVATYHYVEANIIHKIINHLPDLFIKFTYWIQYDWELAWKWLKSSIFSRSLQQKIETNKHPPNEINLKALGTY